MGDMSAPSAPDMEHALSRLNDAQRDAVLDASRALLIIAGAGSGKTQTLTTRIAHMIRVRDVPVGAILAMTFTNKAAREMKERAASISGVAAADLHIGTFHGMCAYMLRVIMNNRDFTILDAAKSGKLLKQVCKGLCTTEEDDEATFRRVQRAMGAWKNAGLTWREVGEPESSGDQTALMAYRQYTDLCRLGNLVDFGDLLILVRDALRGSSDLRARVNAKWLHLMVDEFQDTNAVQMELVKLLAPPGSAAHTITVVGDDYQSIHGWRGAVVQNILEFDGHYPGARVVQLELNYRSTPTIVRASQSVIKKNEFQRHKDMRAAAPDPGQLIAVAAAASEAAEAQFVARTIQAHVVRAAAGDGDDGGGETALRVYDGTAVLYRTHAYSLAFETALSAAGIPFVIHGAHGFYGRTEVKDLLAYLRLAANPCDDESFLRVANVPRRGIGAATLQALQMQRTQEGASGSLAGPQSLFEAAVKSKHKGLRGFVDIVRSLEERAGAPPAELLEHVLSATDYLVKMRGVGDKEGQIERVEAINTLTSVLRGRAGARIRDFLDELDLSSADDGGGGGDADKKRGVRLMTLHTSKGLEFDRVFMVGAMDGMLPHAMSVRENPGTGLEEERRLFYVGMTRARTWLYITHPYVRTRRGQGPPQHVEASQFIDEIDPECVRPMNRRRS